MSPVSRGRKPKAKKGTSGRSAHHRSGLPSVAEIMTKGSHGRGLSDIARPPRGFDGDPERPEWFDSAIDDVLTRSDTLLTARGPRQLEDVTAALLGAPMHRMPVTARVT